MSDHPRRSTTIDVVPTADGYVVYDPERDRVHYLNHTAALLLEFATGKKTVAEIAHLLQVAYDLPDSPDDEVRECMDQLYAERLVHDV